MLKEAQVNENIVEQFRYMHGQERLAHAYLFVGPGYVGKSETAVAIAKIFTGDSRLNIEEGNHPDVHILSSNFREAIKIEQIRALISQVRLRPYMASKKIFIIKNIENLTLEGANALLKTLEEPSADCLLLLTTTSLERNLDTVKSRCHIVHFVASSSEYLASQLVHHGIEDSLELHFYSHISEGSLGAALKNKENKYFCKKNEVIDNFIFSADCEQYIKKILADKEETKIFLDVLLSWIRDAVLVKTEVDGNRLIHLDRKKDLTRFVNNCLYRDLKDVYEEVVNMHKQFLDNLNVKLPVLIIKEKLSHIVA